MINTKGIFVEDFWIAQEKIHFHKWIRMTQQQRGEDESQVEQWDKACLVH